MFIDKARIFVKGGNGGNGIISFRREKYVENGGPAGGDGGRGGNVIFRVDRGLRTLMDFRYQRHFKAPVGERGKVKGMHGAGAEDMIVRVPPGTLVVDEDTGEMIADMTRHGQEVVIAKGGRGGRGNMRFATASNPAPYISENGEEGEERWVVLELKVMADVGLVGFPSVGKSTLLSVVTSAKPKIADYHFTTLSPNLGVVDLEEERSFVIADLPGLIEGAHEGVGLGHDFLRHIERTRVIIHVVDMAATEGRDPFDDWLKINEELKLYNAKLESRPQIIAANKMDMPGAEDQLAFFKEQLEQWLAEHEEDNIDPSEDDSAVEFDENGDPVVAERYPIVAISSLTRLGLNELMYKAADLVETVSDERVAEEVQQVEERKVFTYEKQNELTFTIKKDNETFVVVSEGIEKMMKRMNLTSYDAVMRFARTMRKLGIDEALRAKGAKDGDYVQIGDYAFEFFEGSDYDPS